MVGVKASCEVRAPRFLASQQRTDLCKYSHVTGEAPAECAKAVKLKLHTSRNAALLLDLCTTASSIGPAVCYNKLKADMKPETKLALCERATNDLPAECAETVRHVLRLKRPSDEEIVNMCHNFFGNTSMVAECLKLTPKLKTGNRLTLCRRAVSLSPIECFDLLMLKKKMKTEQVVEVCSGTASIAPAECVLEVKGRWSDQELKELCRGATSIAPATCVAAIASSKVKNSDRIEICKGAVDIGPADCINSASPKLNLEEKKRLCKGSQSTVPAECVRSIRSPLDLSLKVTLCEKTQSIQPALCFNRAKHEFTDKQKVELCRDATSDYPNKCIGTIRAMRVASDLQVALCHKANSISPAECFNELPVGMSQDYGVILCRGTTSTTPAQCAKQAPMKFASEDKVILCSEADSEHPAACARQYIGKVDAKIKAKLCHKAQSNAPAVCFRTAPYFMKTSLKVTLCSQVQDTKPVECVNQIHPRIRDSFRVRACAGATSLTPAHCTMHAFLNRMDLTDDVADECRVAVSTPSGLDITEISHLCPSLLPNCPIQATLWIVDQFGIHIQTNDTYAISVALPPEEDQDVLQGVRSVLSDNGIAHFDKILFAQAGSYSVKFRSPNLKSIGLKIQVEQNVTHMNLVYACNNLYLKLLCSTIPSESPLLEQVQSFEFQIDPIDVVVVLHSRQCQVLATSFV